MTVSLIFPFQTEAPSSLYWNYFFPAPILERIRHVMFYANMNSYEEAVIKSLPSDVSITYWTMPPGQIFSGSLVIEYSGNLLFGLSALIQLISYLPT